MKNPVNTAVCQAMVFTENSKSGVRIQGAVADTAKYKAAFRTRQRLGIFFVKYF